MEWLINNEWMNKLLSFLASSRQKSKKKNITGLPNWETGFSEWETLFPEEWGTLFLDFPEKGTTILSCEIKLSGKDTFGCFLKRPAQRRR